jgi:hypothetical protein
LDVKRHEAKKSVLRQKFCQLAAVKGFFGNLVWPEGGFARKGKIFFVK